jgi:hypothetical protein
VKYLLPILGIATLFACKPAAQKQDGKYFEGFVEFAVTYKAKDPKYINNMKKGFGVRAVTYLGKNGFFSREYIDSNNIILQRQVFRPDSLRFYDISTTNDTILCIDVNRETPDFVFTGVNKNNTFKILNHTVDELNATMTVPLAKGGLGFVNTAYYNDINYLVDPLTYKNVKYESDEKMFSKSPYLTTGIKFQYGDELTMFSIATRIVPSHVPSWHFELPKNKIIIYQTQ